MVAFDVNGNKLWSNMETRGQLMIAQSVAENFNNDNVKDIVLPTENNGIIILDGKTGKSFVQLNDINGKVTTRPIVQDINRDGVTDIVAVTDKNQIIAFSIQNAKVRKLWKVNVPPVLTAPLKFGVIKNHGVIFVATQNDGVIALNSYTGSKIWQSKMEGLLFAGPVLVDADGDSFNDTLVQTTYSGNIIAVDLANGDQIWDVTLPNKIQAEPVVIKTAANSIGELLIADTEGVAHKVNIENGSVIDSNKINNADRFVLTPTLGISKFNVTSAIILTGQNGNAFLYGIDQDNE